MIQHWTACLLVWTLALARGFSYPVVARRAVTTFNPSTRTLGLLRGGQQQDESFEQGTAPEAVTEPQTVAATPDTVKLSAAPIAGMTTMLASLAKSYEHSLAQRPIATKSMTAGIIFGLSDYLAQRIESRNADNKTSLDWTRILASTAVGLFYFGPAAHFWYEWVFRILPGTSLVSTLQKAALGQLLFGPSFTCIYFGVGLAQSGQFTLQNWINKIRRDLFGAWLAGTSFWPLVDVISYSLIPQNYIPLFINLCSLVWTIYLSMLSNRSNKTASA